VLGIFVSDVAVCSSLVAASERQDEDSVGGQRRSEALLMLTEMCPSHALTIRSLCVRCYTDNNIVLPPLLQLLMHCASSCHYL